MSLPLSESVLIASRLTTKQPNLVLCIDGIETCFGSSVIRRVVRIGDPGLLIDGSWLIGGVVDSDQQLTAISLDGSSTSIKQQLEPDKGRGSSVGSLQIELVDLDGEITELITPGFVVDDVLGRKARVFLALSESAVFPDDYVTIFRGIIDDINAGPASITLNLAHPDSKKRQTIYTKVEHKLDGAINNSQTTITLDSSDNLLLPVLGPDGVLDLSFRSYIRVDDEIIEYTGISGLNLTGCVRGSFATIPSAHDDEADIASFYQLTGIAMDLAQKIMLSGGGYWVTKDAAAYQVVPSLGSTPNVIYFEGINIGRDEGVTIGDYVTSTLASNGANNFTLKEITAIEVTETGSYIELAGVSLVDESPTLGEIQFRSKYDSLPDGLGMGADEVDVEQHEYLTTVFLSSFNYDFYLKDTIENAKEFLEKEIYLPASAYSVPRKARASAQLHIGPLPTANMATLSKSNIISASQLKIRRSINKNFFNTIIYKFEEDALEEKFLRGTILQDAPSLTRIKSGTKALIVESKGLRDGLNGENLADISSERKINRYKYGAESLEGVKITFGEGFAVEVADIVIFDPTDLKVVNTVDGNRNKPAALFEVVNKTLNYKTGEVTVDLTDTAFSGSARYCLIGPASKVKIGIDQKHFVIEQSYKGSFGSAEYNRWQRYPDCAVIVRSEDGVTRYAQSVIVDSSSNTIELRDNLGFIPQPGDILELANYSVVDTTDQIKLIYCFQSPLTNGDDAFQML